ncbi:hypothetical protein J6590_045927 [Homalodisca vitripennis]|nr:hypothetical protein J6590_045927 [Homalodisca vitripennis]
MIANVRNPVILSVKCLDKDVASEASIGSGPPSLNKETGQERFKEYNGALLSVHYEKISVVWNPSPQKLVLATFLCLEQHVCLRW